MKPITNAANVERGIEKQATLNTSRNAHIGASSLAERQEEDSLNIYGLLIVIVVCIFIYALIELVTGRLRPADLKSEYFPVEDDDDLTGA